jgi:hypothetical protein
MVGFYITNSMVLSLALRRLLHSLQVQKSRRAERGFLSFGNLISFRAQ